MPKSAVKFPFTTWNQNKTLQNEVHKPSSFHYGINGLEYEAIPKMKVNYCHLLLFYTKYIHNTKRAYLTLLSVRKRKRRQSKFKFVVLHNVVCKYILVSLYGFKLVKRFFHIYHDGGGGKKTMCYRKDKRSKFWVGYYHRYRNKQMVKIRHGV